MSEVKYNLVEHLSKVLDLINKIDGIEKTEESIKIFKNADIRKTFFKKLATSLRAYYLGIDIIFIVNRVLKNADFSNLNLDKFEELHVENIGWLSGSDSAYTDEYNGVLRMNLINASWICFESSLRDINSKLDVVKPKKNGREPNVFCIYKSEKLFGGIVKDGTCVDFLEFFGDCRNAMHNNSIHTKKNHKYVLNGRELKLEKGKKIEFLDAEVLLEMVKKLSSTVLKMWSKLDYKDLILDRYNKS